MRNRFVLASLVWCGLALSVGAATQEETKKSSPPKQPAGDQKPQVITGCLQKGTEPRTFVLQNTDPKGPKTISIVDSQVDLQGYLGLKIEVSGSAASEKEVAAMQPRPSKAQHYMRVTAAKLITTACP